MRPSDMVGSIVEPTPKKELPTWLVGLIIAVVVFAVVLLVANLLGFGDDPVIGALIVVGPRG